MKIYRPILIIAAALLLFAPISLAQTGKLYRVGFLSPGGFAPSTNPGRLTDEIVRHLTQSGFTPGVNLEVDKRGAEGHYERLPGLMAELVAAKVDVIVTFSYPTAAAAKESTSSVPIVTFGTGDPVKTHLVASLNRPGGNITGISDVAGELAPKRLEFLKEAAPQLQSVAMLWNAQDLGMTMRRLPAIYEADNFARDGGLMSYGPDGAETAERGANLVVRILKGGRPADLPFEQPTLFRLVINLKTAKALGLKIPPTLLATADEVIE